MHTKLSICVFPLQKPKPNKTTLVILVFSKPCRSYFFFSYSNFILCFHMRSLFTSKKTKNNLRNNNSDPVGM